MKILIVDSGVMLHQGVSYLLWQRGHSVRYLIPMTGLITFSEEADLRAVSDILEWADVIVLDHDLPGKDGRPDSLTGQAWMAGFRDSLDQEKVVGVSKQFQGYLDRHLFPSYTPDDQQDVAIADAIERHQLALR